MFPTKVARAAGSGASVPVECCQVCGHAPLTRVLSLGYMPPVNQMVAIGEVPRPAHWSGFRIKPLAIEFWHDRPFRLHDRVVFRRPDEASGWSKARLYP